MRTRVAIALLLSLALATAGCGGEDGSPSSEAAPSTSTSPSEEPSSSSAPEPQVDEATGPRLKVPEAAIRMPDQDWIVQIRDGGSQSGATYGSQTGYISISSFPVLSSPDLDEYADLTLEAFRDRQGFDVGPGEDLEVGGVEGRTFVGTSERGPYFVFLAIVGTTEASTVEVEVETSGSVKAHQRAVDSVLASLEWR
ncbi:hypothetical protein I601_0347 [Nocardioides dokdonensis FR1436]|uniref:Lipoprotein LpqN n=1 Tax=Nocardioides dokdonensis FR1436 TaxID=1300347 RepID=A0A1A9GGI9_9ACTN|nr:hypothetical protein [Nocardioides dokdonensis]ANH36800.1 hypothetical protein I601_0347 [Nocardioides dokdonensis FR1436]